MAEEIKAAQHPLSQVPIIFKRLRRGSMSEEGNSSYEETMARRLAPVKLEIPEGYVHVNLKLAATSFLLNNDFRRDLFRHSITQIQSRSIKSEGYFEILKDEMTAGKRQVNWTFRPVTRFTFYNRLNPNERSFHACGGVGSLYIDANPERGLMLYTTPFHPDDLSIALVKKTDLEGAIKGEPISKTRAFINTLKSAARRYT
jgi:hypothetical protein